MPCVEILDAVPHLNLRQVGVPAKNVSRVVVCCQPQGSPRHVKRQPFPIGVEIVQQPRQPVPKKADLLKLKINQSRNVSEERRAVCPQSIELVPVHCKAFLPVPFPLVPFKHLDAQQMLHDLSDARIMVALDPYDFDAPLRIAELANVADELPVLLGEAGKI